MVERNERTRYWAEILLNLHTVAFYVIPVEYLDSASNSSHCLRCWFTDYDDGVMLTDFTGIVYEFEELWKKFGMGNNSRGRMRVQYARQ